MPRSKEKNEEIRERSRSNIIKAALKLFSTRGYHATSTSLIAKEAGVASGLMYNYFASKEELLSQIIDIFFREITESMPPQNYEALDLHLLLDHLFIQLKDKNDEWRVLISIMIQPDISTLCNDKISQFFLHQEHVYEKYYEQKKVARPKESARALWILLHGAILTYALSSDYDSLVFTRETMINPLIDQGLNR